MKLAIIPARGGSKRIPRKNIKHFLGKPIIAYSIQSALESNLFDVVMVSTEDDEIAQVALSYGANVPFKRSQENADDFASTVDVVLEVIKAYEKQGYTIEEACCIYPTAPFVNSELLTRAYHLMIEKKFDTVFPAMKFGFPIQRAIKRLEDGKMEMFQPQYMKSRSQDLETAYHDAGQFYWFKVDKLKESKKLWTNNTGLVILKETEGQDIDNPEDWKLAELKYQLFIEKET